MGLARFDRLSTKGSRCPCFHRLAVHFRYWPPPVFGRITALSPEPGSSVRWTHSSRNPGGHPSRGPDLRQSGRHPGPRRSVLEESCASPHDPTLSLAIARRLLSLQLRRR
ncbi:hypothetical protein MTO96_026867 [Rhipicephalus appendiculatus]